MNVKLPESDDIVAGRMHLGHGVPEASHELALVLHGGGDLPIVPILHVFLPLEVADNVRGLILQLAELLEVHELGDRVLGLLLHEVQESLGRPLPTVLLRHEYICHAEFMPLCTWKHKCVYKKIYQLVSFGRN